MNLPTLAYRKVLESKGINAYFWAYVRNSLIKLLKDPECSMEIHGKMLRLPLSHALPYYLNIFPEYDKLPGRLSEFVHTKRGFLNCIDVGANIGDSIAAFYKDPNDRFLAIEPNPTFNRYLVKNFGSDRNIRILDLFCSSTSSDQKFEIIERSGTATIQSSVEGHTMRADTLENIIKTEKEFADFNLLKIDTDGHDFEVIAGAKGIIKSNSPVVYFECYEADNQTYIQECLKTLSFFQEAGYSSFFVYDNYGSLLGLYPLSKTRAFQNLLFYQLTSGFPYFDILVMPDEYSAEFLGVEQNHFVSKISNDNVRRVARSAIVAGID